MNVPAINLPHLRDALGTVLLETDMPEEFNWTADAKHLIPRPWLARIVEDFTRDPHGNGLLLITGPPGSGKTGFFRERLNVLRDLRPVAHFITDAHPHWDNPADFYDSLSAQLRRKYRLGPPGPPPAGQPEQRALTAAQRFLALLREVSRQLKHSPQPREVLWIDALNTAYGEGAPHFSEDAGPLHELIEAAAAGPGKRLILPPGIYLIATSVDEPHFRHLHPRCRKIVHLDDEKDEGQMKRIDEDIGNFFSSNGFAPAQAQAAIQAVKGNFLFARLWADTVAEGDPGCLPGNLDELLDLVLRRTAERWHAAARTASRDEAAVEVLDFLGLLACTREPLTCHLLDTLFDPERAERFRQLCQVGNHTRLFRLPVAGFADNTLLRFFHGYIVEFLLKDDRKLPAESLLRTLRQRLAGRLRDAGHPHHDDLIQKWHADLAAACSRGKGLLPAAGGRAEKPGDLRAPAYALRHLCSHLRMARDWDRLARELTDARFLLAKLEASRGGIHDLLHSLQNALRGSPKMPADHEQRAAVNAVLRALRPHAEAIADDPFLALQLIRNETPEPKNSDAAPAPAGAGAMGELREQPWYDDLCKTMDRPGRAWLQTRQPSAQAGHHPQRVLRHRSGVLALAFTQGPKGTMLASVGADHRLRVTRLDEKPPRRVILPGPLRPGAAEPAQAADATDAPPAPAGGFGRWGKTPYPPTGLAFVQHGARIATATMGGILLLDPWVDDLAAITDFGVPCAIANRIHSLAAPPSLDRPLVLIGEINGTARVLDLESRRTIRILQPLYPPKPRKKPAKMPDAPADSYCCVALSPDGTLAAVAHPDQTISVWELDIAGYLERMKLRDARAGKNLREDEPEPNLDVHCLHHLPAPTDRRVDSLAFSPCGKILAAGGGQGRGIVELWRLDRGECLCFRAHRNSVWALAFAVVPARGAAQPETILITGSFDRTAAVWKLGDITFAGERERGLEKMKTREGKGAGVIDARYTIGEMPEPLIPAARMAHGDVVMTVAVSPDHTRLATGGEDDSVYLWELGELLHEAPAVQNVGGNLDAGFLHAGAFDPKGEWLATGGVDGSARLWHVRDGKPFETADLGGLAIRSLRFSPDGQRLAIGTARSSVICHLHADGRIRARETIEAAHAIFALAFATGAGSPAYFTGDENGGIFRNHGDQPEQLDQPPAQPHTRAVRALGISPDGQWLARVGDDSRLIVTDLTAEKDGARPPSREHLGRIKSLAFSTRGKWLATGGQETIRIWDTKTWTVTATLRGHRDEIWALAFSPDGRLLASGSRDTTARVWDLAEKKLLCCLPCAHAVLAVQFSEDSRTLRVADAGSGGGIPSIHVAELRSPRL